jgi:hypothetical protein
MAPGDQSGTWGTTTNNNFEYIFESAISGFQQVPIAPTSNNQVLTYVNGATSTPAQDQSIYAFLQLTASAVTANFTLFAPPSPISYVIQNISGYQCTLANSTVIGNTTVAGVEVVIPSGATLSVWSDGVNFYDTKNYAASNFTVGSDFLVNGTSTFEGAITSVGAITAGGVITAASFSGAGTGLTGTASGLTIGGNAGGVTGGAIGSLVYQTAANTTGFLAPSTAGYVLTTNGPGSAPSWGVVGAAGSLVTTDFSIQEVSGKLYFYNGATQIASLDSSGNFTALGNITAYGTP